jgi:hypothetical protein
MSYVHIKNTYEHLNIDDDCGESSTIQLERKALKKLREIEALKKKSNPTEQEQEKIITEKFWKNILHPEENKPDNKPSAKEIKKQLEKEKKRKRDQDKKEQARIRVEEEKEKARIRAEEEKEKARIKAKQELIENILGPFYKNNEAMVIYNEYITILNLQNPKIAFHKLSLKYHPDKNPKKNTTHYQQILQHIHEKIVQQIKI